MEAAGSPPTSSRPLRLVLCPWLAFGHILPYLELAERLASRGHHVSFVSTPRNLARLPPPRHAIDLVSLQLPRVEGLPDGAESTNDVPGDRLPHLFDAFDGLAAPFDKYLAAACAAGEGTTTERPDWVIADTLTHWAATVALEHKVPCVMLLSTAAAIVALGGEAAEHAELAGATVYDQLIAVERPASMPHYYWERMMGLFSPIGASGMSILKRASITLHRCTITAMRDCPEWDLETFSHAVALLGKPVIPLGLLPPSADGGRAADVHRDDATVRWLDTQPPKSVVYVALGSEVPLPLELVHELALGLELSEVRFLWALRKPRGVDDADVLPPGFEERIHGCGLVAMGWVPQVAILSHGAIGAFLTHCGRNSLVEGLQDGHPLIMLPIATDQGPNAWLMERKKIGLQVPRDENDGSFDRHGVVSTVRAVMVEGDARKVFVENALKMQEVVTDKELHERYIDDFVQKLRSYTMESSSSSTATPHTHEA